jgi:hypothetical protein
MLVVLGSDGCLLAFGEEKGVEGIVGSSAAGKAERRGWRGEIRLGLMWGLDVVKATVWQPYVAIGLLICLPADRRHSFRYKSLFTVLRKCQLCLLE